MSYQPKLRPLPEAERRAALEEYLAVLDQHESLAHFRTLVTTGPERQLALIAAFERSVQVGSPQLNPPNFDDQPDLLLCDILDLLDRHPDLKNHGSAYGPDRHLANLQALGIWRGRAPKTTPTARELFTTAFSHLTPAAASTSSSLSPINSPAPQGFIQNGELNTVDCVTIQPISGSTKSPQTFDVTILVSNHDQPSSDKAASESARINHHAAPNPGEECRPLTPSGPDATKSVESQAIPAQPDAPTSQPLTPDSCPLTPVPSRPLRRGRPIALDDLAKGRLLGLMSHGLSFRQAAAQLGVHHVTILNALKRDEQFAQQVSEARLDAISQPLLTVVQASRTNWRAAAWLAKFLNDRRASTYESTPEEHELKKTRTA